jgi:hypothetical protein
MTTYRQPEKQKKKRKGTGEPLPLSPEEYREYLEKTELESIALQSCSSKVRRDFFAESMKNSVSDKVSYELKDSRAAILLHEYRFIITRSTLRDYAVKIVAEFEVVLASDAEMTEEFLETFSRVNLHMNTWPYFREFVQNMIQRMGLPTITLPFLKP